MSQLLLTGRFRGLTYGMIERRLRKQGIIVIKEYSPYAHFDAVVIGKRPGNNKLSTVYAKNLPQLGSEALHALFEGKQTLQQLLRSAATEPEFTEGSNTLLMQLRALLHDAPSRENWCKLCGLLDRCSSNDLEIVVPYVHAHMDANWPVAWPTNSQHARTDADVMEFAALHPAMMNNTKAQQIDAVPNHWFDAITHGSTSLKFQLIRSVSNIHNHGKQHCEVHKLATNPNLKKAQILALHKASNADFMTFQGAHFEHVERLLYTGSLPSPEVFAALDQGMLPKLRHAHFMLGHSHHDLSSLELAGEHLKSLWLSKWHGAFHPERCAGLMRQVNRLSLMHCALKGHRSTRNVLNTLGDGLRHLDLSTNIIGRRGLEALWSSAPLQKLETLALRWCNLTPRAMKTLAEVGPQKPGDLKRLYLGYNIIQDRGMAQFAKADYLTHLTHLELAQNGLTEAGLSAWIGAPHLSRLSHLSVAYNSLGDGFTKALQKHPENAAHLHTLDLRYTHLTGMGVRALVEQSEALRHLKTLGVSGNPGVEAWDLDRLRDALPMLTKIV